MYKSTEIFIPVKVDAQLHLCPPLPAPTSPLLLADCPCPTVPSPQLLRPLGVAKRRRQRPHSVHTLCLHQHPGVRWGFSRSAAAVGIAAVPCLSSMRSRSCRATSFGQERKETVACAIRYSANCRGVNSATVVPPSITPDSEAPPTGSSD